MAPYDLVGFVGAAIVIAAYFANQQRRLRSDDWRYPLANLEKLTKLAERRLPWYGKASRLG
jgi:hypothetical protein